MFRYILKQIFQIYQKKTDGKSLYNNKMRKGRERRLQQIPRKGNVYSPMDTHGDVYSHRLSY